MSDKAGETMTTDNSDEQAFDEQAFYDTLTEEQKKEWEEIRKLEWWDDEQHERMWKILHKAHKAEAKKRGHRFKFYRRSEGCFGSPRIFSLTNPGVGFWTGVNPYTLEAHHLWYPCSDAEMNDWQDLINRQPRMN